MAGYVELQVTTNYSFLRGASHPEELMLAARVMGHGTLAVTDRNTVSGIARAHQRAREAGMRLVVGCRLDLSDGVSALVYPQDRPGWSSLCRLLTHAKRMGKERFDLGWDELRAGEDGLLVALVDERPGADLTRRLGELREAFGDRGYLAMSLRRRPNDAMRLRALERTAREARVRAVATGDVLYHEPRRRVLQDGVPAGAVGGPASQGAERDDAPVRAPSGRGRGDGGAVGAGGVFARHAALPVSGGSGDGRDSAADAGPAVRRGPGPALSGGGAGHGAHAARA
jgi:DNA polymerase III alpha subunit